MLKPYRYPHLMSRYRRIQKKDARIQNRMQERKRKQCFVEKQIYLPKNTLQKIAKPFLSPMIPI